jgi:toxin ParE1/3/4
MSRPLIFMPAARLEFIAAHAWYEREAPGLGSRFVAEVDHQAERIAANPLQFPPVLDDVRRARLRRFPYALFFRPQDDEIQVIACFHASRAPAIWRNRDDDS